VIGVGGLTRPEDARAFLEAGACAALAGTGAALDPHLAIRVKTAAPEL